ncbi:hypothetical protein ACWDBO_51120 [Streptomyces mirabilis]|uniref:hypothetical protein n=1 Tax=Streptomyces mirabilis TaxID=68239 RepID=UPI0031B9CFE1
MTLATASSSSGSVSSTNSGKTSATGRPGSADAARVRAAIRRSGPAPARVSESSTAAAMAPSSVVSAPRAASSDRAWRHVKSANGADTVPSRVHGAVIHPPARVSRTQTWERS